MFLSKDTQVSMNLEAMKHIIDEESKKQDDVEIGQNVLMLNKKIYDTVIFIKKEMAKQDHPLNIVISTFKKLFQEENEVLLCR